MKLPRRKFLKWLSMGAVSAYWGLLTSCDDKKNNNTAVFARKYPLKVPSASQGGLLGYFRPQSSFSISVTPSYFSILPGANTPGLAYVVQDGGKTYVNPTLVVPSGGQLSVTMQNGLAEKTIIHWHGLLLDWLQDGHPYYSAPSGGNYSYNFSVPNRSGLYFYHPHPHGRTGYQVYHGLSGLMIVEDTDELNLRNQLQLTLGETDIPLLLQDRNFNSDNTFLYNPLGPNGNMGVWGEVPLVNFTPWPYLEVRRRIYRFRLLGGANSRPYRLVLLKGNQKQSFHLIGVEGGLLDKPYLVDEIFLAPAERADILIDFRNFQVGDVVRLYNLAHNLVPSGMNPVINSEFEVLEFRITQDDTYTASVPQSLSTLGSLSTSGATTVSLPLQGGQGTFTIGGLQWDSTNPLKDYGLNFNNNQVVIFEFTNSTGMYHPMHLHGPTFQVLRRQNSPQVISTLAQKLNDGTGRMVTDLGWKDTVIVAAGETVQIAMKMQNPGPSSPQYYLLHCHILEHHDAGMMIQYTVT